MRRPCSVHDCPHLVVGEVTVWREHTRNPLVLPMCRTHLDVAYDRLTELLTGSRESVAVEGR